MGILQLNPHSLSSLSLSSSNFFYECKPQKALRACQNIKSLLGRGKIRATGTVSGAESEASISSEEPPSIDFAFVSSVLLPDGTPDVHIRSARGGQKLRDIMLDNNIDLYGPAVEQHVERVWWRLLRGRNYLTFVRTKRRKSLRGNQRIGDLLAKLWLGKKIQGERWSFNSCLSGRLMNGRTLVASDKPS